MCLKVYLNFVQWKVLRIKKENIYEELLPLNILTHTFTINFSSFTISIISPFLCSSVCLSSIHYKTFPTKVFLKFVDLVLCFSVANGLNFKLCIGTLK